MNGGIFITGTDTGVGKTLISALLLSALKQNHIDATYLKPIQTGSDDDTTTVSSLTASQLPAPVYKYPEPISPHRAALLNQDEIFISKIESIWNSLMKQHFVITEGAGGLLVPLNPTENMRDLAKKLNIPILLVASTRLGTINHTLLSLEAARARNLRVAGIVTSGPQDDGLTETLETRGNTKVLTHIPQIEVNKKNISAMATEFFSKNILENILERPM